MGTYSGVGDCPGHYGNRMQLSILTLHNTLDWINKIPENEFPTLDVVTGAYEPPFAHKLLVVTDKIPRKSTTSAVACGLVFLW